MSGHNDSSTGAFLAGFIIGGLVGAVAALVLAPQSGEQTRSQLMQQGNWMRDSAYRQQQAGTDFGGGTVRETDTAAGDTAETRQETPRIVLNGGRTTMADAAADAPDEEAGS